MVRLIAPILALALGMSSAFALVSCGSGEAELLPGETADQIIENLDTVESLAAEGDCEGAQRAAAEVSGQVDSLSGVDRELIQALRRGTDQLETVVAQCEATTVTETTTTETAGTTESERTGRTGTDRSETTDRTTTRPTPTQQTTPTTPTQPTTPPQTTPTTPSPPDSGGSPSGGVTPGASGGGQ